MPDLGVDEVQELNFESGDSDDSSAFATVSINMPVDLSDPEDSWVQHVPVIILVCVVLAYFSILVKDYPFAVEIVSSKESLYEVFPSEMRFLSRSMMLTVCFHP